MRSYYISQDCRRGADYSVVEVKGKNPAKNLSDFQKIYHNDKKILTLKLSASIAQLNQFEDIKKALKIDLQ